MSRGGFGTKIHLACDKNGLPLSAVGTGGQVHDSTQVESVLKKIRVPKKDVADPKPATLAADKACSMPRIRRHLIARAIKLVIPRKSNQQDGRARFEKAVHRNRIIIERLVGWMKESRRIGTRYEKLAIKFMGKVQLAMLKQCFRIMQSPDRA
jgi:transposase